MPIFEAANLYDSVYNAFDYLKKQDSPILGYVIMPNHIHLMLYLHERSKNLNRTIGEMKRFLGYEAIEKLKQAGQANLLSIMAKEVKPADRKRGKLHEVFEDSFDWKLCDSEEFVLQKLQYMHQNPVRGKWSLTDDLIHYEHSSASFYETGVHTAYKVTHYAEYLC
jgi:REP element-mobilizing transposase RayT